MSDTVCHIKQFSKLPANSFPKDLYIVLDVSHILTVAKVCNHCKLTSSNAAHANHRIIMNCICKSYFIRCYKISSYSVTKKYLICYIFTLAPNKGFKRLYLKIPIMYSIKHTLVLPVNSQKLNLLISYLLIFTFTND